MARWCRSGLSVASRSSNRTCGSPASGSRTRSHAFAHGRLRVRAGRWMSPNVSRRDRRVGSRIALFEAPSAFTRVAACTLAKSPKATLCTEGFGCFVASTTAPIATGRSDSCPAGTSTPLKTRALARHTVECGLAARGRSPFGLRAGLRADLRVARSRRIHRFACVCDGVGS